MAETSTFLVGGMTCSHCVGRVSAAVTGLDGVTDVDVQLDTDGDSAVTVTSAEPLDRRLVRRAVVRAGYTFK